MKKFIVSPDIITSEVDSQLVILLKDNKSVAILNETGTLIFNMIDQGKSVGEIKHYLEQEYDVDKSEIKICLREIINSLLSKGVIQSYDESPIL